LLLLLPPPAAAVAAAAAAAAAVCLHQVLSIVLSSIRPDAPLSLPPLFDLLAAMARDLQGEMVPLLAAVWER
jgi:hypothetical protein